MWKCDKYGNVKISRIMKSTDFTGFDFAFHQNLRNIAAA